MYGFEVNTAVFTPSFGDAMLTAFDYACLAADSVVDRGKGLWYIKQDDRKEQEEHNCTITFILQIDKTS